MAKWGEGDPRWIVEERSDGTNVNNWHWTEKNATQWSKNKLTELLVDFKIQDSKHTCRITELSKIEGEASASNRKAKLIFFYEWVVHAKWTGQFEGGDTFEGSIEIPNLSDENDADDIDVNVSVTSNDKDSYKLKEFIRKTGTKLIQDQISKYINDLKIEFSQGMILPTQKTKSFTNVPTPKSLNNFKNMIVGDSSTNTSGLKILTKNVTSKQEFKCRANELYRALTNKDMVSAFTRCKVSSDAIKGGNFHYFDGNVTGTFTKLELNKTIAMSWRFKSWPPGHHSSVELSLEETNCETKLNLKQDGIPANDVERTRNGWSAYYWDAIRNTFGFGSNLY